MPAAEIPIKVPEYFPDLIVTSYNREKGTHANYQAIDLALKDLPYNRDRGSLYWFYYFGAVDLLWRQQRRGILRVAYPPNCPHYHLEFSTDKNLAGVELIKPVKNAKGEWACEYSSHYNWSNASGRSRIRSVEKFRSEMDPWMPGYIERFKAEWKYLTTENAKTIKVHTNNYIGLQDLQNKLTWMFGDGSTVQQIGDVLAQWSGYENASEAKRDLITENPLVWLALGSSLLVGGYFAAKEWRYWQNQPPKK